MNYKWIISYNNSYKIYKIKKVYLNRNISIVLNSCFSFYHVWLLEIFKIRMLFFIKLS